MRRLISIAVLCLLPLAVGCAAKSGGGSAAPPTAAAPVSNVPANSPLAKVQAGMGMKEVSDLIGPPTVASSHITGKAFIPFYFGEDRADVGEYLQGLGRIIYSSANGSPRSSSGSTIRAKPRTVGRTLTTQMGSAV
jgi:hypothetical protein